jgi:hypothetical protein
VVVPVSVSIALSGATVWPTPNQHLGDDLPRIHRRLMVEAIAAWDHRRGSLAEHLEQYARQVVVEVMTEAVAMFWERKAATHEQLGSDHAAAVARACRAKAALVREYGIEGLDEDLAAAIGELDELDQQRGDRAA